MSRLIVKNLPPYVTAPRLREHFEQKGCPSGILTDVRVSLKPGGTSRCFGFVGYKTEDEAHAAKEWFDRTFLDSTRITVAFSEGAKDAPAPRPNKRPRLGPSPYEARKDNRDLTKVTKIDKQENKKTQLDEFMRVMQPLRVPSWANEQQPQSSGFFPKDKDESAEDESVAEPSTTDALDGLSDLDWVKQHMSKTVDEVDKVFEQDKEDEDIDKSTTVPALDPLKDPTKETILHTSRLFVRNLAFSCTEADLLRLFSPFGEVSQVHIPLDPVTHRSKGVSYVTFTSAANAVAAYESLDQKAFQGRLLHILGAMNRKDKFDIKDVPEQKRTVKEERNAKRKSMAHKEFNWGMLYMNSDAVASSIADRMNISKSDILNPESSDSAAVKLALAETHVINETKAFFEAQGVVLTSFANRARSDTTILVKNIPYGTTGSQIKDLFEPHGAVNRVLVPPAGTIAVVDFEQPHEASRAFKAVAYRRLGNSVIYLEKAPIGMFSGRIEERRNTSTSAITTAEQSAGASMEEDEPTLSQGSTLFVKNLSFSTSTERLTEMFRNLPSFSFARIQTKPDPKRPVRSGRSEGRLSMGYGFIGFKDVEGARKALKSMQGFVLDGHALHLRFAGRGIADDTVQKSKDSVSPKSKTTKMIVKNVPFEATKKDIRELFGSHGHLKSVRLPKKFDSRSRGFAFLEFVSHQEAQNAFDSLRHTHLLGRHLVLEWADEAEQDLDILRKKAAVGFGAGKEIPGRKRKLDMGEHREEDLE